MNGFTVKPHHPSAQVQSAIVVEEHAFRHAEDRFPLKFQHSETSRRAVDDLPNPCFCGQLYPIIRTSVRNRCFAIAELRLTHRHWWRVMVLSPTFGVRNVHLVAQNVPYHAGLLPHFKRFDGCQTVQSIKHLVACERAAIATAEYLFKQLPKFTFLHAPKCTQQAQPKRKRPTEQAAGR